MDIIVSRQFLAFAISYSSCLTRASKSGGGRLGVGTLVG